MHQIKPDIIKKINSNLWGEGKRRILTGFPGKLHKAIGFFAAIYIFWAIIYYPQPIFHRSLSFGLFFALTFMTYTMPGTDTRNRIPWYDWVLALLSITVSIYIFLNLDRLVHRFVFVDTVYTLDIIMGILTILLLLEGTRRVIGPWLSLLSIISLGYLWAGPYITGRFGHKGFSGAHIIEELFLTTDGIWGNIMGVATNEVILFVIFGAFLLYSGAGAFLFDFAAAIAGWSRGGLAKIAILASGLFGMISGSPVANASTVGVITIPMMKKLGYKPEFAGAVEAAASTGGQLMPPIMGAAAFLMAEMVGVPYIQIAKAAAIPALLYFTGIMIGVHLEAKKNGLKGIPRELLPRMGRILLDRGHLALPLVAIIYLLVAGYTPMRAALWAIALTILASMLRSSTRMSIKDIIKGLADGARSALGVIIACACAGIIIGVVTKTGLGLKLGSVLIDLAGGYLLPTLFFTMITSIILGMGVPTTANYIITATIAAPAIIQLGVPVLAAHLFTFYFGIIADITPPVALAAFAGAGIARGNPFMTGIRASMLAVGAFIIPYIFVMSPALILIDVTSPKILMLLITSVAGMAAVSAAVFGFLFTTTGWIDRLCFLAGGLMLIDPGMTTDFVGLGVLAVGLTMHWFKKKSDEQKGIVFL